ncbi:MAG: extracellular solute-binding protein [Verrucomicrobia bacterium]|nr:extracellular solute-binding protein [Verrucomicrobiota bacterium]
MFYRQVMMGLNFTRILLLLIALLSIATGVARENEKEEPKILLKATGLWGGSVTFRKDARTPSEKAGAEILDAFLTKFPQYGFAQSRTIRLPGKAFESALLMAMAGRTAGDIIYVNFRVVDNWVRQNFLIPLDAFVLEYAEEECQRRGIDCPKPLTLDKVNPEWVGLNHQTWDTIYRPDTKGNWHVWSWPYSEVAMALYYRKDILKEKAPLLNAAGLEVRAPRTWEEMIAYCRVLTDPTKNEFAFQSTSYAGWYFADLLWQGGVEIVERDAKLEWHVTWDAPGTIDTVRFWRELTTTEVEKDGKSGFMAMDAGRTASRMGFNEGKAAFMWSYSSDLSLGQSAVDPEILGAAPLPAGPVQTTDCKSADELLQKYPHPTKKGWVLFQNGRQAPARSLVNFGDGWRIQGNEINAGMWGICSLCTDPKRQRAAWEWLKFQNSDEARRIRTTVLVESGSAIYVRPDLLKKYGFEEYYEQVPADWREANEDVFRTGRPEPNGKNCQYVYDFIEIPARDAAEFTSLGERRARTQNRLVAASWRQAMGGRDDDLVSKMKAQGTVSESEIALLKKDTADIQVSVTKSVERAKRRMLDQLPEAELSKYRKWALAIVVAVAIICVIGLRAIVRYYGGDAQAQMLGQRHPLRVHATAWMFMSAALLSVLVWHYYPLARGAVIAFQEYQVMGGSRFIGLDNFVKVFIEPLFLKAVINTLLWVVLSLGLTFFPPIFLAIILDEIPRGKLLFRIIFYLPAVMSGLVVAYLWLWMFSPSADGLLNSLLIKLHLAKTSEPVAWLTSSRVLAMICVIIPGIWAGVGPGCIIYLAALKSIPEDIYEAADLDGASPLHKVFTITIPYLKPLIIINFVGAFIGAFRSWEGIFVMTGGGPADGTHVLGMEVWYNAFAYLRFGYATAVAWVIGSALVGFTVYQLRILRNVRFTTAKRD